MAPGQSGMTMSPCMSPGSTQRTFVTIDEEFIKEEDVNRVSSTDRRLTERPIAKVTANDNFHDIDKARKKLLHTQACDGTWHLLAAVAPSVLPEVILSVDFWLSVL